MQTRWVGISWRKSDGIANTCSGFSGRAVICVRPHDAAVGAYAFFSFNSDLASRQRPELRFVNQDGGSAEPLLVDYRAAEILRAPAAVTGRMVRLSEASHVSADACIRNRRASSSNGLF